MGMFRAQGKCRKKRKTQPRKHGLFRGRVVEKNTKDQGCIFHCIKKTIRGECMSHDLSLLVFTCAILCYQNTKLHNLLCTKK